MFITITIAMASQSVPTVPTVPTFCVKKVVVKWSEIPEESTVAGKALWDKIMTRYNDYTDKVAKNSADNAAANKAATNPLKFRQVILGNPPSLQQKA